MGTTTTFRNGKVLIVDDEAMICQILGEVLSDEFSTLALTSAHAAWERIAGGERFDVILSDLTMPEMSGIDLYGAIARVAPEQAERIVFLTGGNLNERCSKFLASIANPVLQKPFGWTALLELVGQVARRSIAGEGGRRPAPD